MSDNTALVQIPLEHLFESPFNPRKAFDEADLQDLANNIKAEGMLQPLLVRPRVGALFAKTDDPNAIAGYELVFGHRRLRAAELAGLGTAPCVVRSMDDGEVKRAQISENLQRKDVTPLEEAAAFQVLIDEHNETAERIAEQIGKSKSYVYGRLKLLGLCATVRKDLEVGSIDAEVALLIARLRLPKLQEKALGYIKGKYIKLEDGGQESYRRIKALMREHFTLGLKDAPFPIEDEMLVPLAGNCVTCPKRTGNAPEFADIAGEKEKDGWKREPAGADVCTDPECFQAKKAAQQLRQADALRAKGETVIGGAKARQLVDAQGHIKGGYVALKDVKAELAVAKKKVAKGETSAAPSVVTIQDPRTGKTFKAVKIEEAKAAGVEVKAPSESASARNAAAERERAKLDAQAKAESSFRLAILDRTLDAMRNQPRTTLELYWMALTCFNGADWDARNLLAKRHGFKDGNGLEKVLGQWPADRLAHFAVECMLIEEVDVDAYNIGYSKAERLMLAAKHYGIDVAAARAKASKPAPTPPPAARAAKGAKAGKAGAGAGAKKAKAPVDNDGQVPLEETGSAGQEQTVNAGSAGEAAPAEVAQ